MSAPHSVEAEQAVLGGLMLDNTAWPVASAIITAGDFYRRDHQLIFGAIADLASRSEPFDAVTLAEVLERKALADQTGGLVYLVGLVRDTPSAANIRAYAEIVRERAQLRKLRECGEQIIRLSVDSAGRSTSDLVRDSVALLSNVHGRQRQESRYLKWSALSEAAPPARKWLMPDWLTTGPTLCSGRGGAGKSTLAQTIASSLATATQYITPIERPFVNLAWFCEDSHDEIWRRGVQICSALQISMKDLDDQFYAESRLGCENTLFAPVMGRMQWTPAFELLKEQIHDVAADVLWIDNIGQTFGGNENDRHPVTAYVNGLLGIRPGLAVVLLGHPARSNGSEYAGSAAWENAVRMRWYFGDRLPDQRGDDDSEPDADVRFLCRRKANYTGRDYRKFTFTNGVFMPEEPNAPAFSDRYGRHREDLSAIVLAGFDKCMAAGITPTDGPSSPDYLPRRLIDMKLNGGHGKKEMAAAMNRLLADGRLKRGQVGTYSNRSPKMGLIRP